MCTTTPLRWGWARERASPSGAARGLQQARGKPNHPDAAAPTCSSLPRWLLLPAVAALRISARAAVHPLRLPTCTAMPPVPARLPRSAVHFFASSDKAKRVLGWQPQHNFLKDVDQVGLIWAVLRWEDVPCRAVLLSCAALCCGGAALCCAVLCR